MTPELTPEAFHSLIFWSVAFGFLGGLLLGGVIMSVYWTLHERCRHSWQVVSSAHIGKGVSDFYHRTMVVKRCVGCGTYRTQELDGWHKIDVEAPYL